MQVRTRQMAGGSGSDPAPAFASAWGAALKESADAGQVVGGGARAEEVAALGRVVVMLMHLVGVLVWQSHEGRSCATAPGMLSFASCRCFSSKVRMTGE